MRDGRATGCEAIDGAALARLQAASYERSGSAVLGAWPEGSAMDGEELARFLSEQDFCIAATTTHRGKAQARPVAFTVVGSTFWLATGDGSRLGNLERLPWISLVVAEGGRRTHRAVVVDGPVLIVERPQQSVIAVWEERHESRGDWAAAWLEVRPARLFSYYPGGGGPARR